MTFYVIFTCYYYIMDIVSVISVCMCQVAAYATLRLADDPVLPFRVVDLALMVQNYVNDLKMQGVLGMSDHYQTLNTSYLLVFQIFSILFVGFLYQ